MLTTFEFQIWFRNVYPYYKHKQQTLPLTAPVISVSYEYPTFLPSPSGIRFNCWYITCKIDSKLKVRPFQSVNSPLTAPVINRLPSGTHCIGREYTEYTPVTRYSEWGHSPSHSCDRSLNFSSFQRSTINYADFRASTID